MFVCKAVPACECCILLAQHSASHAHADLLAPPYRCTRQACCKVFDSAPLFIGRDLQGRHCKSDLLQLEMVFIPICMCIAPLCRRSRYSDHPVFSLSSKVCLRNACEGRREERQEQGGTKRGVIGKQQTQAPRFSIDPDPATHRAFWRRVRQSWPSTGRIGMGLCA